MDPMSSQMIDSSTRYHRAVSRAPNRQASNAGGHTAPTEAPPIVVAMYPEKQRKERKECGTSLPELPIKAPYAVLDADEALATRRIHERAELIDCAVIPRRELEHCLYAVQREATEIGKHALDELPPSINYTKTKRTTTTHLPEHLHLLCLLLLHREHSRLFLREHRA